MGSRLQDFPLRKIKVITVKKIELFDVRSSRFLGEHLDFLGKSCQRRRFLLTFFRCSKKVSRTAWGAVRNNQLLKGIIL